MRDSEKQCPQCGARLTKHGHCSRTVQALSGADAFIDAPIEPEKMLWHLAHGRGPFTTPEDIEIIHWLANREISRREKQDRAETENAKLRADFRPPTDSVPLSEMLPKSFSVLLDTFNDDDYDRAYASIESFVTALIEEIEKLRVSVRAVEHWNSQQRYRDSAREATERYGFKEGELQSLWRGPDCFKRKYEVGEVIAAICDALTREGQTAWSGDGTSCVEQMIRLQWDRAERAEAELAKSRSLGTLE